MFGCLFGCLDVLVVGCFVALLHLWLFGCLFGWLCVCVVGFLDVWLVV